MIALHKNILRSQNRYLGIALTIALVIPLMLLPIVHAETGNTETEITAPGDAEAGNTEIEITAPGDAEAAGEVYQPEPVTANAGAAEDAQSPFAYWAPDDARAFIPSASAEIPPGIELIGVIIAPGEKTIAAVSIPGFKEPFYVSENDVIGVPIKNSGNSPGSNITYIEIGSIDKRQIKLFPRANPRNIQILQ